MALQYNSKDVAITFAGLPISDSRQADDFLTIEAVQPERHTMVVGADGEVTYSQSNDNTHKCTIKLLQASEGNAILSAILNGDLNVAGGSGVAPFAVLDANGVSTLIEPEARIEGWPSKTYGEKADKVLEWVILCPDPARFEGGYL